MVRDGGLDLRVARHLKLDIQRRGCGGRRSSDGGESSEASEELHDC